MITTFAGKPLVIAIAGKQRSGKDYCAGLLTQRIPSLRRIALADSLKLQWLEAQDAGRYDALMEQGGSDAVLEYVNEIKAQPAVRRSLIDYGQAAKAGNPYHWVDKVLDRLHGYTTVSGVVVPDLRYLCEVERFQREEREGKIKLLLVRIEASRETRLARGTLSNEDDPSECELDGMSYWDYTVCNEVDAWLQRRIDEIVARVSSAEFNES